MLIKRLYEEYDLNLERILSKESKRLKLTSDELVVLFTLLSLYRRRVFSIKTIAKRVEFDENKIGRLVDRLIEKSFLVLKLEDKDGKEREVFDLSPTFIKLEELFSQDESSKLLEENQTNIALCVAKIEKIILRNLSSFEIETIRRMYDEALYPHSQIMETIEKLSTHARFSVKYLERHLIREAHQLTVEPNDEADQALDKIFKKIK